MKIEDVIKTLETKKTAVLAKEIGIGEKKLREALKVAGYEYSNAGDKGWRYIAEGEQPLEKNIQDFITIHTTLVNRTSVPKKSYKEDSGNVLTTHEVSMLREILNEWKTIKEAVSNVSTSREEEIGDGLIAHGVATHSQQPIHSIHSLYIRVKEEIQPQEKMRKTLNVNKGVGMALDQFASKYKLEKQDIIELALYDFFEKYGEDYTE